MTYSINGGYPSNATGVFTGLAAGTYQVSVTDVNNCPAVLSTSITIDNPAVISITNETSTDITCNNANDGTITVTGAGGTAPLTYTITGGASNGTGVFTNLSAGNYSVTVSDANGCPTAVSSTFTVVNPAVISISNESSTDITCHNANDGTVTIVGSGGTAPLTYTITGGSSNQTGFFTNLTAGNYAVTVSDANGCPTAVSSTFTIVNPDGIAITNESSTDLTCNNANDGTITITTSGGTAPLTYSINGGYPSNATGVFTGLAAGTYQVSVTDVNNCPAVLSTSITIDNPAVISITNETSTDITCNNANDGTITVTGAGGTAPLTYTITGGASNGTGVFVGLAGGTYQVSVTDVNNCTQAVSSLIEIINPLAITIIGVNSNDITCNGLTDGFIDVKATGGTPPYTYSINGGYPANNDGNFSGLSAGTYIVSITDVNGCPDATTAPIEILDPSVISITSEDATDITCNNENDGTVTIVATGGTGSLVYSINGAATQASPGVFTNLAEGDYQVTITDANNCGPVLSSSFTIDNPPALTVDTETVTNIQCNGAGDVGQIEVVVSGGTGDLTYDIGNGSPQVNDGVFTALGVGNYQITVTDANLCTITSNILSVIEPDPLVVTTIDSLYSCGSLPVIEADQIFLPDGTGQVYTSVINHTDFAEGTTVQANDIESIALNLEHSYSGDLTINVKCPNGQSMLLSNKRGGSKFIGEPVRDPSDFSDSDLTAGLGYSYVFTSDATYTWQTVPIVRYSYTDLGGY